MSKSNGTGKPQPVDLESNCISVESNLDGDSVGKSV